jgi:hypothetical protein
MMPALIQWQFVARGARKARFASEEHVPIPKYRWFMVDLS